MEDLSEFSGGLHGIERSYLELVLLSSPRKRGGDLLVSRTRCGAPQGGAVLRAATGTRARIFFLLS
jgi:hypothetical protein